MQLNNASLARKCLTAVIAMALPIAASAAPVIVESPYIRTAIGDNGTLGFGGNTSPGLQHDPSGTGNWGVEDYLTPGSPWEYFGVSTHQTGTVGNNNEDWGVSPIFTTSGPLDVSATSAFDYHVIWAGQYGVGGSAFFEITHSYFFNQNNERINIETTITALQTLTGGRFLRAIDPDPDVNTHGDYDTINSRGGAGIAPEDFVNSVGSHTGLTLGLFTRSDMVHNTGISASWTTDPEFYLAGTNDGNGDYVIGLAFDFGNLNAGESITMSYAYVMGGTLDTVDIPDPGQIPEPATLGLLGIGLFGLAAGMRRRRKQ